MPRIRTSFYGTVLRSFTERPPYEVTDYCPLVLRYCFAVICHTKTKVGLVNGFQRFILKSGTYTLYNVFRVGRVFGWKRLDDCLRTRPDGKPSKIASAGLARHGGPWGEAAGCYFQTLRQIGPGRLFVLTLPGSSRLTPTPDFTRGYSSA